MSESKGEKSFNTGPGAVGVEFRDLAVDIPIVGDIKTQSSTGKNVTISGSDVTLDVNNDKSKITNTNRFDNLPKLPESNSTQPQLGDSSMSR